MKKTRILQVTGGLGIGGIEKLVVSFYEKINRDKFEMDFLVYGEKIGELEEKVPFTKLVDNAKKALAK